VIIETGSKWTPCLPGDHLAAKAMNMETSAPVLNNVIIWLVPNVSYMSCLPGLLVAIRMRRYASGRQRLAHREVQAEDADVVRQQHVERLLGVPPGAAVAVAVDHARHRRSAHAPRPVVAALQLLLARVLLRGEQLTQQLSAGTSSGRVLDSGRAGVRGVRRTSTMSSLRNFFPSRVSLQRRPPSSSSVL